MNTQKIKEIRFSNKELSYGLIILHIILFILLGVAGYTIFKDEILNIPNLFKNSAKKIEIVQFFILLFVSIVIHELIHGIFFSIYTQWKHIKFGFKWEYMAAYCTTFEPLKVKNFKIVLLAPTIFLGFLPLIYSLIFHNFIVFLYAFFMILGGVGDFFVLWEIRKLSNNQYIADHPEALGYFLLEKKLSYDEMFNYLKSNEKKTIEKKSSINKKYLVLCLHLVL